MNDWNPLETQLRSWTPRRPSARLKTRLFSRRLVTAPVAALSWNWLAPATGCLMLFFVTFGQRGHGFGSLTVMQGVPEIAITLSNQSWAAYFPGGFPNELNTVPASTFQWTNAARSPSSIPSLSRIGTNEFRR